MRTYCLALGTLAVLRGDINGKKIQKRGDIHIHIADLLCYKVETKQHCKATIFR